MRRLFKSNTTAVQGAVYCEDVNGPFENCCPDPPPEARLLSGVGCIPDFPDEYGDNRTGSLPTTYGPDSEIDIEEGYVVQFLPILEGLIDGSIRIGPPSGSGIISTAATVLDPNYPDMWSLLDNEGGIGLQNRILVQSCYCIGEGIPGGLLPNAGCNPQPFFWLPPVEIPADAIPAPEAYITSVRANNPDSVNTCCDDAITGIKSSVVDGELRLNYTPDPSPEVKADTDCTDVAFTKSNGFPRYCCGIQDDENGDPQDVKVLLGFPRAGRNGGEEPLLCMPVVVDIQCDPASGDLFVYYANLIFYDGILHDYQWDAGPPRPGPSSAGPEEAPDDPRDLGINLDYGGVNDLVEDFGSASGEITCDDAIQMVDCASLCIPAPSSTGLSTRDMEKMVGNPAVKEAATEEEAIFLALAALSAMADEGHTIALAPVIKFEGGFRATAYAIRNNESEDV